MPSPEKLASLKKRSLESIIHGLSEFRRIDSPEMGDLFPSAEARIGIDSYFTPPGDLAKEIKWLCAYVCVYGEKLSDFLAQRDNFSNNLLMGEYELATADLDKIKTAFGYSIWHLSARILLAQLAGGFIANCKIARAASDSESNAVQIFGYFFSIRSSLESGYSTYDSTVDQMLSFDSIKARSYKLNVSPYSFESVGDRMLADNIFCDSNLPLIDRYLFFSRNVKLFLASSPAPRKERMVGAFVSRMYDATKDRSLLAISGLLGDLDPDRIEWDRDYIEILDTNLRSQHPNDLTNSYNLDHIKAADIELICEEVKLLIATSSSPAEHEPRTLHQSLKSCLYELLLPKKQEGWNLIQLKRLSYVLSDLPLSTHLHAKYLRHANRKSKLDGRNLLVMSGLRIHPLRLLSNFSKRQSDIIQALTRSFPHSAVAILAHQVDLAVHTGSLDGFNVEVPRSTKARYQAIVHSALDAHRDAHAMGLIAREGARDSMEIADDDAALYHYAYEAGMYEECLRIAITSAFEAPAQHTYVHGHQLAKNLDVETLASKYPWEPFAALYCWIRQDVLDEESRMELFLRYETYLDQVGVHLPSALSTIRDKITPNFLIYFLREICVPDVMDSSAKFRSQEEVFQERISVLELLRELDLENADQYSDEIAVLRRDEAVRGAVLSIDSSKVHVDLEGIRSLIAREAADKFERLQQLVSLSPAERRRLLPNTRFVVGEREFVFTMDRERHILCEELVGEIKSLYLWNDAFGLDSYLSVRIRHGTLAGQLRSPFEKNQLVTKFNSTSNRYEESLFWIGDFVTNDVEETRVNRFQSSIAEFSKSVDQKIEDIRTRWVQLKTDQNPEGFFDFDLDQSETRPLAQQAFTNFDDFVDSIFDILDRRTQENLERLRDALVGELTKEFTALLDGFRQEVESLGIRIVAFEDQVAKCRTDIQTCLLAIASWFELTREQRFSEPTDFGLVLDTAIEIVHGTYENSFVYPTISRHVEQTIAGAKFQYLLDLLLLPIENVVKHGDCKNSSDFRITASSNGGLLVLEFENRVSAQKYESLDLQRIRDLEYLVNSGSIRPTIRKEGGTGYHKLAKILKHDLGCSSYSIKLEPSSESFSATIQFSLDAVL